MTKRIVIFYSLLAFSLLAQVDTGTIVGTLRDPSGAACHLRQSLSLQKQRTPAQLCARTTRGITHLLRFTWEFTR